MDRLSVRFRCGITGYAQGVTGSPGIKVPVDQAYGPVLVGAMWQMSAPVLGLTLGPDSSATLDMTIGDFTDMAGHAIVGPEAFGDVRSLMLVHAADSLANRLMIKFGHGNHFQGPFQAVDNHDHLMPGAAAACFLTPGAGIDIFNTILAWPLPGDPTARTSGTEPTSGILPQDGWQIYLRNWDHEHEASFFLNIVGRKVG